MNHAPDAARYTPRSVKLRLCGMMFLQYFVQGAYLPIVAGYLTDTLGFSESNKGWSTAAIGAGPILAPLVV